MITKHGKVIISETEIRIEDFTFDCGGEDISKVSTSYLDAIDWAIERLPERKEEQAGQNG